MDLSISKGQVNDVTVLVNNTEVTVQQANNIVIEVTPSPTQYVAIDRGLTGPQGPTGPTGPQGPAGQGVPTGGTANQILTKDSSTDYDDSWQSHATLDYLQLNTAAAASIALGKLRWNASTATAAFGIIDGTVECNIGEQMFAYVTNADSVTITKGQPVYLYRATGNRASIKLASNLGDATSAKTLGLATQDIAPNQTGFVTTQGTLDKLSTASFAEGDTLYLGATAGTLTNVKPKAPNHLVYIGVVERSNNGNGQIYIKPQNGYELDEIHDVQINSPVNGQTIIYDASTSLWKNANLTQGTGIGIANGASSVTITNTAPDQVVSLLGTGTTTVTGTYPSFTINSTGGGSGTVTSVAATGGTGISVTGSPITSSGTLNITNTAPDQTVVMNSGTGISVTGTYPNFTVTNTSPSSGGTVTSVTGTAPVVSSGGTTPDISMAKATTSVDGYLSATDWNTFNNKGSGTVTSVGGTGTVSGIALSGTVTSSGNLTLGGSLDLSAPPAIGATTPSTGKFTTLEATGNSTFGTASANYLSATGVAAGSAPYLAVAGTDPNIYFQYRTKGTGAHDFYTNGVLQLRINNTTSAVNRIEATGSIAGAGVQISAQGSDGNIPLVLQPKGTGALDIASGSKGVNLSNGNTVTAINRSAAGSGYTSFPTLTIGLPQTTGGVQAVASVNNMVSSAATIAGGGTGYTVGDVLTLVGGTGTAGTFTVSTVSSGVITAVTSTTGSAYTVLPSNPVSVTGGTGTGATLTVTYGIGTTFTISNAGSGYVEQPTITFSSGGGTGASAYAVVGAGAVFRSLGSTGTQSLDFYTPNSITSSVPAFRIRDGVNADCYPIISNTAGSVAITNGGVATSSMFFIAGTGNISLQTGGSLTQFRASHTASAVNYIQATGGATGIAAQLSAQGTDTDIPLVLQPKGTGALQAQRTDSAVAGGNARGANSTDFQTGRGGPTNVASGTASFIGSGSSNTASGNFTGLVAGLNNTTLATGVFIGAGNGNTANSPYSSVVGGYQNSALGYINFVGGGQLNSGTSASAVTTQSATMNGTTAVTLSGSNANIKVGQLITGTSIATYTYVAAISGTALTLSQNASGSSTSTLSFFTPHGVVVGGGNNQATGSYSVICGGGDAGTAANRNVASGDWGTVGGGWKNTASGLFSGALSGTNNTASGVSSVVCGGGSFGSITQISGNTASGLASFVGAGFSNNSTSNAAFVGAGSSNTASGIYSAVIAGSSGTTRGIWGNHVIPALNPMASPQGASQSAVLVVGKQTTDATATVLTVDGGVAGTVNQVIMPNNSAYYFKGTVVAGKTGAGDTKGWTIEGVIKRGANAASTAIVGTATVTSLYADAGAATWALTATADTTNGGLAITVTGQAATTIRWVAKVETTEMTY